jgi:MraZ protein
VAPSGKKWDKVVKNMFRGVNAITLDTKGRLTVPARYRSRLQESAYGQIVITIDPEERCLLLYPLPAWEEIEHKIEALSSFNPITRRIQRLLIGHATEEELDGNGRILIPPLLRTHAGLKSKIMLLGQGKKFEIWDETNWKKEREKWHDDGWLSDGELPEELRLLAL